jgi:hypothetical protein
LESYDWEAYSGPARDEPVDTVAARWWQSTGDDGYHDALAIFLEDRPAEAPLLIAAMVSTRPPDRHLGWIGTGPLESMYYASHDSKAIADLMRAAPISSDERISILSGVWPGLLSEWEIAVTLKDIIPAARLTWLLDIQAPGRSEPL